MSSRFQALQADLAVRYPGFRVRAFDELWLFRVLLKLGWPMAALTWFTTVWMDRKYIEAYPESSGYRTLRHEAIHLEQWKQHGVFFLVAYALLLPTLITFRASLEYPAYLETLRTYIEDSADCLVPSVRVEWVADTFVNGSYFFMYPYPLRSRLLKQLWADVAKMQIQEQKRRAAKS